MPPGAMARDLAEYLSLLMGFQFLLLLVAAFSVAALATRKATPASGLTACFWPRRPSRRVADSRGRG